MIQWWWILVTIVLMTAAFLGFVWWLGGQSDEYKARLIEDARRSRE